MPIVIKADPNQSTNDVIREFKKATAATGIVIKAKDNRYYKKPALVKAAKTASKRKTQKRYRSMKKMKNVSEKQLRHLSGAGR